MTDRIEISEDYLFAKIGRLVVENEFLRAQVTAAQTPPPPPPPPSEERGSST